MHASLRHRLFATLFAACACAFGSASAADRRDTRDVAGFDSVLLAAPLNLEIVQGEREDLELDGDEAALALIKTVVEDRVLKIRLERRFAALGSFKVRGLLHARRVDGLAIAGSGDIKAGALSGTGKLSIAGSGDIRIGALTATGLEVKITGSGDVSIGGKADSLATRISGSGDINAGKLETKRATVSIAGSGDTTVWARESLAVSISGAGDVRYYGDPALDKAISGSGSVRRLGGAPSG